MGRISNYGGNVFWPHRVDCVCNEKGQEKGRIKGPRSSNRLANEQAGR